ncbi:two-component system osmolarity sensor histidine kinase EnvZ [Loktanella ponticola]|uniref:histidine kinase n=1 Tax=Yoonia ponticola TaxID=1524255 RepID=A0A7W9BJ77_9RHOB|nr:ATP-binding protein [Yoonia ponticola]MBB5721445.1 two-component system osmolarity sensor histidine kinase EnvZ [Yoonia ponticola]
MFLRWIKNAMPRGIYGRAALILVLPVVTLQLLVSVVFIQRHFDGVTQSMTSAMAIELRYLQSEVNAADDLDAADVALDRVNTGLELTTTLPASPMFSEDVKPFWDLTGRKVITNLRENVPDVLQISLAERRVVQLWLGTNKGPLEVSFRRNRVSASNPHQLLVIMMVMGAVMTTISYFFLRNQLRPIKRMAAAASDYGRGRMTPFNPTGAIEVRAAGMAFLDMRNRIERQTQSRTLMLSGVSHDLRSPLTRMRLGLSMLDGEDVDPLIKDVDEMQHLLDGFLDFARSDAEDVLEPTDPVALLDALLEDAARSNLAVTCDNTTPLGTIVAMRPRAIRRALDNLVGNALRYGQRAHISLSITDRSIRFTVEDDGPGIPAEQRDEATRPFVRLDPARNQDRGSGVGLGLSIVSDIARTHGGMLRLGESDDLGGLKADLVLAR